MKYCPRCKLKAKDDETSCSRCGGELRVLGGSAPASTPPAESPAPQPTRPGGEASQQAQLRLELAGLQHQVTKSAARVRRMAIAAGVLALLLVLVLLLVRHNHVMEFAALEGVDIVASKSRPGTVEISYQPRSTGKVEFIRETRQRRETLIEYATDEDTRGDKKGFTWSGGKSDRYTVHVRYRRGWGLVTEDFQSSK